MTVMNLQDVWDEVLKQLEDDLNPRIYSIWFSPIKYKACTESKIILEVPNTFFRDWIVDNYHERLNKEINTRTQQAIELEFIIAIEGENNEQPKASTPTLPEEVHSTQHAFTDQFKVNTNVQLKTGYTFEDFVIGTSNQFAHAACLAIAQSPAKAYNPLFIYGGVGLGKTHLMHAIGHYIIKKNPRSNIVYVSSEKFTNHLIKSIQNRSTTKFRQEYRHVDVLLIDDIQFIAGKESTQEEFFHTFNSLHDAHKQIVLTADCPPSEISNLENRLVSRFEWGLVTDIQPPDYETRLAILRNKAAHETITVPDEILQFIAENIKSNIRQLEGALIRVVAYANLMGVTFSVDIAKKILKDYIQEQQTTITIDYIQRIVANSFSISHQDLKGKKRTKNIVLPRQIAMYLCRKLTSCSLPEIAAEFGKRDHTTILHGCDKITKQIQTSQELSLQVNTLKKEICG